MKTLLQHSSVLIRQRKEMAELFGFETRNKYEILDPQGKLLFYCAERRKGFFGALLRLVLGHWRSFELHFFDSQRQRLWKAVHPFRFLFQRLDMSLDQGEFLGSAEWKWGIFRKRYLIDYPGSQAPMWIESGFLSFWTFPVSRRNREVGKIQKKWSGLLKEMFTDTDNFLVEFGPDLSERDRALVLSTAILVDLTYFENKAGKG